jgi:hypothetical protein
VDRESIRRRCEAEALAGVGMFQFGARKAAKAAAATAAVAAIAAEEARVAAVQRAQQADLDAAWSRLLQNEPDTVLATLEDAFADNEAPAAAVACLDGEVSLLVLVPGEAVLPERLPAAKSSGAPTLKKATKAERAAVYRELVCGHVLLTVREALAVAPGLRSALVIALRATAPDSYGHTGLECLLGLRLTRDSLTGIRWDTATASQIISDAGSDVILAARGTARALTPIDVAEHPELAALIGSLEDQMADTG